MVGKRRKDGNWEKLKQATGAEVDEGANGQVVVTPYALAQSSYVIGEVIPTGSILVITE